MSSKNKLPKNKKTKSEPGGELCIPDGKGGYSDWAIHAELLAQVSDDEAVRHVRKLLGDEEADKYGTLFKLD